MEQIHTEDGQLFVKVSDQGGRNLKVFLLSAVDSKEAFTSRFVSLKDVQHLMLMSILNPEFGELHSTA